MYAVTPGPVLFRLEECWIGESAHQALHAIACNIRGCTTVAMELHWHCTVAHHTTRSAASSVEMKGTFDFLQVREAREQFQSQGILECPVNCSVALTQKHSYTFHVSTC